MQSEERLAKLALLEGLLTELHLRPSDLMRSLREVRAARGTHLHELSDEQLDKQIADAEASLARAVGREEAPPTVGSIVSHIKGIADKREG